MVIKLLNAAKKKQENATPIPPAPSKQEELLMEIRDLLKK
jgi:large conductance mechanosensitive channel